MFVSPLASGRCGDCLCGDPGSPGLTFPSLAPGELLRACWCSFRGGAPSGVVLLPKWCSSACWCTCRRGAPVDAGAAGPSLYAPPGLCLGDTALPPRGPPPVPGHPPCTRPCQPGTRRSLSSSLPPGTPAPPPRPRVLFLSNLHRPPRSRFVPGKAVCQQCAHAGLPRGVSARVRVSVWCAWLWVHVCVVCVCVHISECVYIVCASATACGCGCDCTCVCECTCVRVSARVLCVQV